MINKPQTFIFVGRSGSGKGTQIDLLKKYITELNPEIGTHYFIMGDIFRSFMKGKGYAQEAIHNIVSNGTLVPDFIANSLFISKLLYDLKSNEHLYLDGIPRSLAQTDTVIEIIKFYNRFDPILINIEVSKEEVEKRMLLRARPDDTKEAIIERLKFYEEHVAPAVSLLKEKSGFIYLEVDGEKGIEDIHKDIISKLTTYLS